MTDSVVPMSVHSAIDKAGAYFGVEIRKVGLRAQTYEVDLCKMNGAIDSNTVAVRCVTT